MTGIRKGCAPLCVAALLMTAASAYADDSGPRYNRVGVAVGAMTHRFASGPDYDQANTSTNLQWALSYARGTSKGVAIRIEIALASRDLEAVVPAYSDPSVFVVLRVSEYFVEVPIILSLEEVTAVGDHEVRLSVGGGAYVGVLASQELLSPDGPAAFPPGTSTTSGFGDYKRFGWLMDGNVTLAFSKQRGLFAGFRLQYDAFDESNSMAVARRDEAFGFYAGIEKGF